MVAIKLDLDRVNELAGVEFDLNDINEIVELLSLYAKRFLADQQVPIWMERDWPGLDNPRGAEVDARRATVLAISEIWRSRGGKTIGSFYSDVDDGYNGPLIDLLDNLMSAVQVANRPSRDTLHHDLHFLATGKERNHARKV
jgi:hypothetical protein